MIVSASSHGANAGARPTPPGCGAAGLRSTLVAALAVAVLAPSSPADAAPRKPRFDVKAGAGEVRALAVSPDGSEFAAAFADHRIRVWPVHAVPPVLAPSRVIAVGRLTAEPRSAALRAEERSIELLYLPDGATLVEAFAQGPLPGALRLWDARGGDGGRILIDGLSSLRCLALSRDGRLLAVGQPDPENQGQKIELIEADGGRVVRSLRARGLFVSGLSFDPQADRLVSFGGLKATLWDTASGDAIRTFEGHKKQIDAAALSPDGATLATGGGEGVIRLWNVADGATTKELKTAHERVLTLAFSPSGKSLVSGGDDKCVRIWSTAIHRQRENLCWHRAKVTAVRVTPDGRSLISASRDDSIAVWDFSEPEHEEPPEDDEP